MQIRANANENQVILTSSAARARAQERSGVNAREQNKRNTIFMGDLNVKKDAVTQRKQHAQQKALKMIGDAWNVDRKIDQNIQDIRDKLVLLHEERDANLEVIAEGEAQKEALRQQYGVESDSQEQKDLELLEKKADAVRRPGEVFLTDEERARLKEMEDTPLTEYQQRCMEIDGFQQIYEKKNDLIEDQIEAYNGSIRATRLERLKFHEMVKA
ncbi:MAG: hypothetical protein K2O13_00110, partial [Lachnospiraceae bacterium]|nr:hypothetical protein [Lachnospiraceae bacterium]